MELTTMKKKLIKGSLIFLSLILFSGVVMNFVNQKYKKEAMEAGFSSFEEFSEYKIAGYQTKAEFDSTGFLNLKESSEYRSAGFSSLEEFRSSGFTSPTEAKQYKSLGFNTKSELMDTDFSSFEEAKEYIDAGYALKKEFEETGFSNFEEAGEYRDAGYSTKDEFDETGFIDLKHAIALKPYGDTYGEAIAAESRVSLEEFKECDKAGGSIYKNECYGKNVIWYAKIDRYADSGLYLDIVESCTQNSSEAKAAWTKDLSYDFWKQNEGACIQFIANIRDENWATPTIIVNKVLWIESLESKIKRIEEEESLAEQERIRDEEQKVAELEQNKFNPEWLADKFGIAGGIQCKPHVESLAKHTYRWTDGWLDTKFPSYLVSNQGEPFVLTLVGDKIEFQNGFGAWSKTKYFCKYNVKTKKVLDVWAN